jgi:hypothetical protein
MVDKFDSKVDQYITSVMFLVQRLPPFEFEKVNGFSYLNIKSENEIIYYSKRQMSIIPMLGERIQMIILPRS